MFTLNLHGSVVYGARRRRYYYRKNKINYILLLHLWRVNWNGEKNHKFYYRPSSTDLLWMGRNWKCIGQNCNNNNNNNQNRQTQFGIIFFCLSSFLSLLRAVGFCDLPELQLNVYYNVAFSKEKKNPHRSLIRMVCLFLYDYYYCYECCWNFVFFLFRLFRFSMLSVVFFWHDSKVLVCKVNTNFCAI